MSERYRIEEMSGGGWCMVRNHDDELISIYDTREQAEAALREANPSLQGAGHLVDRTLQGVVGIPGSKT